ncbi:hypothetical protein [Rhizobium sp. 18065]|uniref:hypothetical protein n=1 Tax=Rhizobium sp. 18065 TaxID=2681411 RepID=UPI00135981F5|nr:hypothetical protein [Rhizobium sp. 18065]
MIFGMTPFTFFHVLLSLIGIAAGFVALQGWLRSELRSGWTALFLATTIATVVTGFLFPYTVFTPAIGVGIITAVFLIVAVYALYRGHLSGHWRPAFVICSVVSLYLNTFVLVVQAFLKVPTLNALAPNGSEPPFAIAQGLVLVAFLGLGYLATVRFRPGLAAGLRSRF